MRAATAFLEALVEAVPYRIYTMLIDNGIQFAICSRAARDQQHASADSLSTGSASFTESNTGSLSNHPWTNGQVERMNKTIKDATVKRYFYDPITNSKRT